MKINPLTAAWNLIGKIQDRNGSGQNPNQPQQDQKKKEEKKETIEVTDEKVQAALRDFNQETSINTAGLSAEIQGRGPGMRVMLKDGSGAFVRVFTGEEFLKLRETAKAEAGNRGRLLDRKF